MKKLASALAVHASAVPLSIVNNIPGPYTSIVGQVGTTAIAGVLDDSEHNIASAVGNIAMPAGTWRIGNNGVVIVAAAGEIGFTNAAIPAAGNPAGIPAHGGALLPLWDDHIPTSGQGGNTIHHRTDPDVTTIEWFNEDHFSATGTGTITFQLKVFADGAGPGGALAQFIYPDSIYAAGAAQNFAGSATIGYLTDALPHNNVQWSFNAVQPADPGNPDGMITLSLIPEPASLVLLVLGGLFVGRRR
jgi:hypothetical protein